MTAEGVFSSGARIIKFPATKRSFLDTIPCIAERIRALRRAQGLPVQQLLKITLSDGAAMSKNKKNNGNQAPAQQHAEGQHGQKTIDFLRKQHVEKSGTASKDTGPQHDDADIRKHDAPGKKRLFEDREQHDDADKLSEKTRLARDADRHGHGTDTPRKRAERQASAKRKGS